MKKAVPLIYSLKTLCAFAVVALHSDLYYKSLVIPLLRIAVPVFFIISGYFYNITATPKILKKIIKLCLITNIVYLSHHVIMFSIKGHNYILDTFNFNFCVRQIMFGNMIEGVLWYLTAYIEVIIILWFLQRYLKFKYIIVLSLILLIIGIVCGSYGIFFGFHNYLLTGGALMTGLPAVVFGIFIRIHENKISQIKIESIVLILLILSYIEYFILYKNNNYSYSFGGDVFIFTLPLAVSVFILILKYKNHRIPYIEEIGKNDSSFIYCYHMLVQYIILAIFNYCNFVILLSTCLLLKLAYNKFCLK